MKRFFGKKLRYGSASAGITLAVVAAVLLLNIGFSLLCNNALWFIDLTSEEMYTLTDESSKMLSDTIEAVNATRDPEDPVKVDIIFCADPDLLCGNESMRYIYYTALDLQEMFPDTIRVSTTDVWKNPSSVDAYRTTSYSSIYQSNVIVASGTEFRVYAQKAFYTYSEATDTEPWAYNGEKTFIKGIIAVTRAEAPICCLTTNHGEPFGNETEAANYSEFVKVIENAGYDVRTLDLEKEEIPEDCRLIITFDPKTDFVSDFLDKTKVSETKKLEAFLDKTYSFMVFADADTPVLTNLEEFLEEWGISFAHTTANEGGSDVQKNDLICDAANALDGKGYTFAAQYETEALGGSITTDIRKAGGSPRIVFGNAMGIRYSPTYQNAYQLEDAENNIGAYTYGYYFRNNYSREIYDVFRSSDTSLAYLRKDGVTATDSDGAPIPSDTSGNFRLMTISRQSRTVGEGKGYTTVNEASYVCAVGSVDFASNEILSTNSYGNTDVLLSALRAVGREIVPVGINFKPLYDETVGTNYYTSAGTTAATAAFVAIPLGICLVAGLVILIRRKYRT